jgi:hypothetical protein
MAQSYSALRRDWPIYRNRYGRPRWFQRWLEAWWIITGKWSLHRAWQGGFDAGHASEYRRLIINGAAVTELAHRKQRLDAAE